MRSEAGNVSLVRPCRELRESYIECLKDFQAEDPGRPIQWEWLEKFELYLDFCEREQRPEGHAEERVPQTTYWIVLDGNKAVGKLTLRHRLTPALERLGGHFGYEIRPAFRRKGIAGRAFALGLDKARESGLAEVVVTCDDDNLGSIGVLEKNGGTLLETYALADWPKPVRKYGFRLQVS